MYGFGYAGPLLLRAGDFSYSAQASHVAASLVTEPTERGLP